MRIAAEQQSVLLRPENWSVCVWSHVGECVCVECVTHVYPVCVCVSRSPVYISVHVQTPHLRGQTGYT